MSSRAKMASRRTHWHGLTHVGKVRWSCLTEDLYKNNACLNSTRCFTRSQWSWSRTAAVICWNFRRLQHQHSFVINQIDYLLQLCDLWDVGCSCVHYRMSVQCPQLLQVIPKMFVDMCQPVSTSSTRSSRGSCGVSALLICNHRQ